MHEHGISLTVIARKWHLILSKACCMNETVLQNISSKAYYKRYFVLDYEEIKFPGIANN